MLSAGCAAWRRLSSLLGVPAAVVMCWLAGAAGDAALAMAGPAAAAAPPVAASGAAPAYYFRQTPQVGVVTPAAHSLTANERAFLAQLPVIRVGLNLPDNRPYEVIAANGEISGIQVEILTHVALALGVRVQPVVLPSFPATLAALRERRIDLMTTVGYAPSHEAYMAYTLGTAPNPGAILGRELDPRFAGAPTLNGRRVAIERGYVSQYYVRRLYPDALVVDHPDTASALRAVALGEDDYYVGSLLMAMDRLQRDQIRGLAVKQPLVYATGLMHFGVRNDWPLLASAISKGVGALRQSPLPALQAALGVLGPQSTPGNLALNAQEQAQLAGRSVLRVGAVRGLSLLNEAMPDGSHAGIAADYTAQVAARLGAAVDVLPFDSVALMLEALRAGEIHLVPLLTRTPERAKQFVYSDPYLEMPYHVITRSDTPLYWDLGSLRGKRLALTPQHPLTEFLASHYPDIVVVDAPPGGGAMDMVAAGSAEAAVEAKLFANLRINSDNNGVLRQVARVDEIPAQFHFAASQEAAGLIPLVNRALADIPEAERQRLYRRWVAVDFNPGFAWQRHAPWMLTAGAALLLGLLASAWWMRRLAREVASRTEAEQRLRDLTNHLPGMVFQAVVDPVGQLLAHAISAGADRLLGSGFQSDLNLPALVLAQVPPDQVAAVRAAQAHSLRTGEPFKQTFCYQHRQSGPRWLHCEATVRPLAPGRLAWTGYLVDVSSEREMQAELLEAVQAKNLFVANASHELRAPLQTIVLALSHLGSGPLDPAQRQTWRVAKESSDALVRLIDDVLDLARIDAGRIRLQPLPMALQPWLTQIVAQHRLGAEARGLAFELVCLPGLPQTVCLDALRLRQLLSNLIGNAIKYTAQGKVTVTAGPLAGLMPQPDELNDSGPQWLVLSVRDTGAGISPDQQKSLFEPFGALATGDAMADSPVAGDGQVRPDIDRPPSKGGRSTGLGLAICKRLVQAMQGEIMVISQPGMGTEVRVHLPMPTLAAVGAIPAPGTTPMLRRGTVLMVDDDPVSRLLMAEMLRRSGYAVAEAADAVEALAIWHSQDLAAVISDRHMPGADGPALLRQIRDEAHAQHRVCPGLVLCTGDTDIAAAAELEVILTKPVSVAQLAQALGSLGVVPGLP